MTTTAVADFHDVSTFRLYFLRVSYFLMFVGLGVLNWPLLLNSPQPIAPMPGVAHSLWAALSTVALLGVRHPLKMLPVLLLQLTYKTIWVTTIALPLWRAGALEWDMVTMAMVTGVVFDLVVIPWPHVVAHYIRPPAEPLRGGTAGQRSALNRTGAHPGEPHGEPVVARR